MTTTAPTIDDAVAAALAARPAVLPAEDERQIQRLGLAYGLACDFAQVDALVALFTPDAVWDGAALRMPRVEGHDALRAHFTEQCPPGLRQVHVLEQVLVSAGATPDEASGIVYFHAMQAPEGVKAGPAAYGAYEDTYRRVDGTWLIASRTLHLRVVR